MDVNTKVGEECATAWVVWWRPRQPQFRRRQVQHSAVTSSTPPQSALKTTRELPPNFSFDSKRPDFWLGYLRDDCHLRHPQAPVIFEHRREGAPLVIVRDLRGGQGRGRSGR